MFAAAAGASDTERDPSQGNSSDALPTKSSDIEVSLSVKDQQQNDEAAH